MADYVTPILFAVALWWSTTAAAIHLNGLPRHTFPWTMGAATVVMLGAFGLLHALSDDTTAAGAYLAFSCGVLFWAWQDIGFYLGIVTGRRKDRCPDDCSGWAHFGHAIDASIHHEIAILVAAAAIFALLWGAPNDFGLWTFCVLWWMHQSAKLNVFLGVTNLNTEFLPEQLRFLEGYFRKRPMNLLFPISITVSTVVTAVLANKALQAAPGSFDAVGYCLLATLMALAVLEHWFLVVPLPSEKLWQWAIIPSNALPRCRVDIVAGTLGAGKTTYLKRLMESVPPAERTVVIANDFGQLGIDAALLGERGAHVVELANGCICCTLKNDLAAEIGAILTRWRPSRLLIEPSGVADLGALMAVVARAGVLPAESTVTVHAIFDASRFTADYGRYRPQFEAQARLAQTLIVNKADLAGPADLDVVTETLRSLAPGARLFLAERGAIAGEIGTTGSVAVAALATAPAHGGHAGHSHAGHSHALESWSAALRRPCSVDGLRQVLSSVASGGYGNVERLKGIAETSGGWVHFDVAGGRPSIAAFAAGEREQARVMAIGTGVDTARLADAFNACGVSAAS